MTRAFVQDGDLGSGKPGSLEWHKCNLLQLDKEGRIAYITEAFPNMTDEDKLSVAVFLIMECLRDGDSQ